MKPAISHSSTLKMNTIHVLHPKSANNEQNCYVIFTVWTRLGGLAKPADFSAAFSLPAYEKAVLMRSLSVQIFLMKCVLFTPGRRDSQGSPLWVACLSTCTTPFGEPCKL